MKTLPLCTALLSLWAGSLLAQVAPPAPEPERPVLWSVRFDAERLRSGVGRDLFAALDPILTTFSGEKSSTPGGKLESLAFSGYQPKKGVRGDLPFVADIRFSPEGGGISRRFDAVTKKHDVPVEPLAGSPTIHFQHEGKEVWIAKFSDTRILLSTSRALLETSLLGLGNGSVASTPVANPDEMLGGKVDIKPLLTEYPPLRESELLKMLAQLDFQLLSQGEQLNLTASAEMDSERSAKRASRMIDGMVAAISMHEVGGVPWDDRLTLKQDGSRLGLQFHLEPQEAKLLFNTFAREIEKQAKAAAQRDE